MTQVGAGMWRCPPDTHRPGVVTLEPGCMNQAEALEGKSRSVVAWPAPGWRSGGVCAIAIGEENGDRIAGTDPRRECTALAR